jgi:hypothetical protein
MSVLKSITSFAGLAVGVPTSLPHGLVDQLGVGVVPDHIEDNNPDVVVVSADNLNVTVRNDGVAPVSCDVLCERWHSIPRSLPPGQANLPVQPFIPSSGGAGFNPILANIATDIIGPAFNQRIPFSLPGGGGLTQSMLLSFDGFGVLAIGDDLGAGSVTGTTSIGSGSLIQRNNQAIRMEVSVFNGQNGTGTIRCNGSNGINMQNWLFGPADGASPRTLAAIEAGIILGSGSTTADNYVEMGAGTTVPVSPASKCRLRYNVGTQKLQVSENGGAYANVI